MAVGTIEGKRFAQKTREPSADPHRKMHTQGPRAAVPQPSCVPLWASIRFRIGFLKTCAIYFGNGLSETV